MANIPPLSPIRGLAAQMAGTRIFNPYISPERPQIVPLEATIENLEATTVTICHLLNQMDFSPVETFQNGDLAELNIAVYQFNQIAEQRNLVNLDVTIASVIESFARNILGKSLDFFENGVEQLRDLQNPEEGRFETLNIQREQYRALWGRLAARPITEEVLQNLQMHGEVLALWEEAARTAFRLFERAVDPEGMYGRQDLAEAIEDRHTLSRFAHLINRFSELQPVDDDRQRPRQNRVNRVNGHRNRVRGVQNPVRLIFGRVPLAVNQGNRHRNRVRDENVRVRLNFDEVPGDVDQAFNMVPLQRFPRGGN